MRPLVEPPTLLEPATCGSPDRDELPLRLHRHRLRRRRLLLIEVWQGRESHLRTRPPDLDSGGDLDIVSIGDQEHVWLRRNDAIEIKGLNSRVAHDGLPAQPERSWFVRLTDLLTRSVN